MKTGKQRKENRRRRSFIPKMWARAFMRQYRFKLQVVRTTLEGAEQRADEARLGGQLIRFSKSTEGRGA
jgi:hypothetical protein